MVKVNVSPAKTSRNVLSPFWSFQVPCSFSWSFLASPPAARPALKKPMIPTRIQPCAFMKSPPRKSETSLPSLLLNDAVMWHQGRVLPVVEVQLRPRIAHHTARHAGRGTGHHAGNAWY